MRGSLDILLAALLLPIGLASAAYTTTPVGAATTVLAFSDDEEQVHGSSTRHGYRVGAKKRRQVEHREHHEPDAGSGEAGETGRPSAAGDGLQAPAERVTAAGGGTEPGCEPSTRQEITGPAGVQRSVSLCPDPTDEPDTTDTSGGDGGDAQVSITTLVATARARLPVPDPVIKTAPPRGTNALVAMPQWFWPAKNQWATRSATAKLDGLSATVTAKATAITIDPGDGSAPVSCTAPWTPYTPQVNQRDGCTHTYTSHGHYTATVTVHWAASWTGSTGAGGTLPTLSTHTSFPITVVQASSQLIADP